MGDDGMRGAWETRETPQIRKRRTAPLRLSRRWPVVVAVGVLSGALGAANAGAVADAGTAGRCDREPTGVVTEDYWLPFRVPEGLMPDEQFDGRPARLHIHRVRPEYARRKCSDVRNRAAVLIHGRTITGPAGFDLRHPAPDGGTLSTQRALARAGVDTFAPSLLGYGRSTRFRDGLDDPGNASLRPYVNGACPYPEGCDRTHNPIFPLDQQGTLLIDNPLDGQRRPHSSNERFARTDVWVRDIRQVVDDAIRRARPSDGKVTLIGHSLGAHRVGRTLYPDNPVLPGSAEVIRKVNRAVFLSTAVFGVPTEETAPPGGFATFPLSLVPFSNVGGGVPPGRNEVCTGRIVPGSTDRLQQQMRREDPLGSTWGGTSPEDAPGYNRTPTFSSYGWNPAVAQRLTTPALIMHGTDDTDPAAPPSNATAVYDNLRVENKVLVHVGCASHGMLWEGCEGPRCTPESGTPYGGRPGRPWAGPHATVQAALIEWIRNGTFDGAASGRFLVDESGVARPS